MFHAMGAYLSALSPAQSRLLASVYRSFVKSGTWPSVRRVRVEFDSEGPFADLIRGLTPDLLMVSGNGDQPTDRCELRLRGLLHVSESSGDRDNIVRVLRYLAREYLARAPLNPEADVSVPPSEILRALNLEEPALRRVLVLLTYQPARALKSNPTIGQVLADVVLMPDITEFKDLATFDELTNGAGSTPGPTPSTLTVRTSPPRGGSPAPFGLGAFLSADRPIKGSHEDLLGRAPFARQVASAIAGWKEPESLVLAVDGPWGSGKSSVKNMILEALKSLGPETAPTVIEFSPWEYGNSERLTAAFFREVGLGLGVGEDEEKFKRLATLWRAYEGYLHAGAVITGGTGKAALWLAGLSGVTLLLGVVVPVPLLKGAFVTLAALCAAASAFFRLGKEAAQSVAAAFAAHAEARKRSIGKIRSDIASVMKTVERPTLVVIDDVDRLASSEVSLVFELVKANGDFPRLIYLLLYQRDLVEESLGKVAPGDPSAFLEKIVQASFSLPRIEFIRLERVLIAGLNQLLGDSTLQVRFDEERWTDLHLGALRPFFQTLRDVRRYLNTLAFHVSLFRGSNTFEVNATDLIGLEVLRVFEPQVYALVAGSKELLTSGRPSARMTGPGGEDSIKAAVESLLAKASDGRRPEVRELLKQLFPSASWVFENVTTLGNSDQLFRDLRVAHPDIFDRYFLLIIPEGDLSQEELNRLLSLTNDRTALVKALEELRSRSLLTAALNGLDSYKEEIPVSNGSSVALALYDIGDELEVGSGAGLSLGQDVLASRIVRWTVIREPRQEERLRILRTAITGTRGIYLPTRQVSLAAGEQESRGEKLLDAASIQELRELMVKRLRTAAADGSLGKQRHLGYLLYRWRDWASPEEAGGFVKELALKGGVLAVLRALGHVVTSVSMDSYSARRTYEIRLSEVEKFIPVESLESQVSSLDTTTLDKTDANMVAVLRQAVEARSQEPPRPETESAK